MRKYWIIFQVALAERLVYRVDFFVSTFLRFIPIVTTILLWRAIYTGANTDEVGDLTYSQMVGYYLFVTITRAFGSMPGLAGSISSDIRDGNLRKYLLQPIDYLGYNVVLRCAHKLVYFIMATVPYALVFWMCGRFLPGWPDAITFLLILASLILAFMLGFAINALFGLLGFWFLEVHGLLNVFMTAQYFLSGHMLPLSLLPDWLQTAVGWLPFAYETYYPTLIMLQKLDLTQMLNVILVQFLWAAALLLFARWVWSRGLRRYAAFGG